MRRATKILLLLPAVLAMTIVQPAFAGEIPNNVLAQMGLGSMDRMSDEEGSQVRGEGFASVFGIGFASVILASRLDNHSATSNIFNAVATGDSLSQVSTSVELTLFGQSLTLSLNASAFGQGFAFGR